MNFIENRGKIFIVSFVSVSEPIFCVLPFLNIFVQYIQMPGQYE